MYPPSWLTMNNSNDFIQAISICDRDGKKVRKVPFVRKLDWKKT